VPDAVVTDPTPTGLVFQTASAPCSSGFPCAVGAIGAGASITFTATYAVTPGFGGGQVVNVASVGSPTVPDPTPNDNTSTATVTVIGGGGPPNAIATPVNARWALLAMIGLLMMFGAFAGRKLSRNR
jgi:hypothetical protein